MKCLSENTVVFDKVFLGRGSVLIICFTSVPNVLCKIHKVCNLLNRIFHETVVLMVQVKHKNRCIDVFY